MSVKSKIRREEEPRWIEEVMRWSEVKASWVIERILKINPPNHHDIFLSSRVSLNPVCKEFYYNFFS